MSGKIRIDGKKPSCGLCYSDGPIFTVGFFNDSAVRIVNRKLHVYPAFDNKNGINSIYANSIPVTFCPFCGRDLRVPETIEIRADGKSCGKFVIDDPIDLSTLKKGSII